MAQLRAATTPPRTFRTLIGEITRALVYEALRDVHTAPVEVVTPIAPMMGSRIAERIVVVPILRAGMGMLNAVLEAAPDAAVGFLGMQRNEQTAVPEPYYVKVPADDGKSLVLVIDPMLATGGSACDAVATIKKLGYKRIKFLNIVSAPEGVARLTKEHPDVEIFTAAHDERLNERFYIVPGLGDAGDRVFATL